MQRKAPTRIVAHAPGSLMLLGEYAVLHDYPALVCAINQRLTVQLTVRDDDCIKLSSDRYGQYEATLSQLPAVNEFAFVLAIVRYYREALPSGFELSITSGFSDQVGFGSSAALVAATLAAFNEWLQLQLTSLDMVRIGRQMIQQVQSGRGSGADVAASIYGGIITYCQTPLAVQQLALSYPLVAFYAGFKTKTADAIQKITTAFKPYPELYQALIKAIGECAHAGILCVRQHDWQGLGALFTIQQGLMEALGVSLPILQQMLGQLYEMPTIIGAKISGAGLGDCVIGLGTLNAENVLPYAGSTYLPVAMSQEGVQCERLE